MKILVNQIQVSPQIPIVNFQIRLPFAENHLIGIAVELQTRNVLAQTQIYGILSLYTPSDRTVFFGKTLVPESNLHNQDFFTPVQTFGLNDGTPWISGKQIEFEPYDLWINQALIEGFFFNPRNPEDTTYTFNIYLKFST